MPFSAYSCVDYNVVGLRHESFILRKLCGCNTFVYHCELCDIYMEENEIDIHCTTSQLHRQRIMQVRAMQNNPISRCAAKLQIEIDRLGSSSWQQKIQSKIHWAFMHQYSDDAEIPQAYINEALQLLNKCAKMEITSLLELAIWKSVCIQSKPYSMIMAESSQGTTNSDNISSTSNDYIVWQNWIQNGWKQQKNMLPRQKCAEISTILPLVCQYLFPAPEQHHHDINDDRGDGAGGHILEPAAEAVAGAPAADVVDHEAIDNDHDNAIINDLRRRIRVLRESRIVSDTNMVQHLIDLIAAQDNPRPRRRVHFAEDNDRPQRRPRRSSSSRR